MSKTNQLLARRCLNHLCPGREWFRIGDLGHEKYVACPSCGYPSVAEPFTGNDNDFLIALAIGSMRGEA